MDYINYSSINGSITNDSPTNSINTIISNINNSNSLINTISWSLNNLTIYISIKSILGEVNFNCNKINYNGFNVIKPQTEFTNNIALKQSINRLL